MKINQNYKNLKDNYLFAEVGKRAAAYSAAHPEKKVIRLGIGDVTRPLAPAVVTALKNAAEEMGHAETFRGYGPYEGYQFLTDAIRGYYSKIGVELENGEVFVSDGAKDDIGSFLDIFDKDNTVLVPDPVYPVYVDTNIMDGRRIIYMAGNADNDFLPMPDESVNADIIYICSPNNPTGAVYTYRQLEIWVEYAIKKNAVILFDAAYEAFVDDPSLPRSIFEIDGARECAVEFCSLSKTAGFTGTRCGYTVIPNTLTRGGAKLASMWARRISTKFNGTSYIIQRGAAAVFTDEGMAQTRDTLAYYKENARIISTALDALGIRYTGGKNSPYIWLRCPDGMKSWDFFDFLLENANVVGTPGAGFGEMGEGWFRLTSFGSREATTEAVERIKMLLSK